MLPSFANFLARRGISQRVETYSAKKMAWVTPSRWLSNLAMTSKPLRGETVHTIPNGIDLAVFHPAAKAKAKLDLGLPLDRPIVLFGAASSTTDPRKGFDLLLAALTEMYRLYPNQMLSLAVFGNGPETSQVSTFPYKINYLGQFSEDSKLASIYAAADVFVAPSRQENLANTVVESLGVGTPVVAFDIGGMPDMIEHLKNGFLARPFDSTDMARGISWVIDKARNPELQKAARKTAETLFSAERQADSFRKLYHSLLV